jgi:hypothetical protein
MIKAMERGSAASRGTLFSFGNLTREDNEAYINLFNIY